jgi:serine/threonine-protein kinase/endoribonuclease IRE1
MPRPRRPPGVGPAFTILTLLLLPSLLVAAQQQQPAEQHARSKSPSTGPRVEQHTRNTPHHHRKHTQEGSLSDAERRRLAYTPILAAENERALATKVSSAPAISAVRARHGAGAASGVLAPSARSLQDWEVEDFVLLATVDGHIHARDRYNGEEIWEIAGKPMLSTTYNGSADQANLADQPFVWIVEPREEGALYVLMPGPFPVLQSLGLTVKQLTDIAPYSSDDPDLPVVYNVEKRTFMLKVDAATGFVKQSFSPSGTFGESDDSCASPVKNVFNERDCRGDFEIGQTEYTIIIHNRKTNEQVCTIKYAEWVSNSRDMDLKTQYTKTMDDQYIYGRYNGEVFAVDHKRPRPGKRPLFIRNLPSAPLVLLPQPAGPTVLEEKANQVWLNTTETGAWYALSEMSYPAVTDGAPMASCYNENNLLDLDLSHSLPIDEKTLVGVHKLNYQFDAPSRFQAIAAPTHYQAQTGQAYSIPPSSSPMQRPTIDAPPEPIMEMRSWLPTSQTLLFSILMVVFVSLGKWMGPGKLAPFWSLLWNQLPSSMQPSKKKSLLPVSPASPAVVEPTKEDEDKPAVVADVVSDHIASQSIEQATEKAPVEPARNLEAKEKKVVTFSVPGDDEEDLSLSRTTTAGQGTPDEETEPFPAIDSNLEASSNAGGADGTTQDPSGAPATPKKKKTHRGKRGGRKLSKNQQRDDDEVDRIVDAAKQLDPSPGLHPDEITMNGDDMQDVTNVKRIGKLTIDQDRLLGNGSGGTFVFEGKWNVSIQSISPQSRSNTI